MWGKENNMKKNIILFSSVILCMTSIFCATSKTNGKAVVIVPIADLVGGTILGEPILKTTNAYDNMPVYAANRCQRIHQLLYNEVVEIINTRGDEVCIRISNVFYVIQASHEPQTTYWTHKKNIITLDRIQKYTINPAHIPTPIDFRDPDHHALYNKNIVTLREPFYNRATKQTFSAGTRFVRAPQSTRTRKQYIKAYSIDYNKMKQYVIRIPRKSCILYDSQKKPHERLDDFVGVLRAWAHKAPDCIAYVWGGCSFTDTVPTAFNRVAFSVEKNSYYYERKNNTSLPKAGFDCTGMIARAAQLCGIPYFCKNTTTIPQFIPRLGKNDRIEVGDLIVVRGHVMVVANKQKNTLIEARAYPHGYGKVQEIALKKVFQGIHSYKDLYKAYQEKKALKRMDKGGKVRDVFKRFSIHRIIPARA